MQVRAATAADYDGYARLFPELRVDDPMPSAERFANDLVARSLVAVDGGDVVGFAMVEQLAEVGYVRNIMTAPERRRHGVGLALMTAMRERFLAARATSWCLNVKRDNAPAIALYERCGLQAAYRSSALRVPSTVTLDAPAPGITLVPIPPERDAVVEPAMRLLRGQLASARTKRGRQVVQLVNGDELLGVAVFSPAIPGAFPCRLIEPAFASTLLAGLRALAPPAAAYVQVGIEDDDALRTELLRLGAFVQVEIVHMRGEL